MFDENRSEPSIVFHRGKSIPWHSFLLLLLLLPVFTQASSRFQMVHCVYFTHGVPNKLNDALVLVSCFPLIPLIPHVHIHPLMEKEYCHSSITSSKLLSRISPIDHQIELSFTCLRYDLNSNCEWYSRRNNNNNNNIWYRDYQNWKEDKGKEKKTIRNRECYGIVRFSFLFFSLNSSNWENIELRKYKLFAVSIYIFA